VSGARSVTGLDGLDHPDRDTGRGFPRAARTLVG
jgi:hypothetical protein